MATTLLIISMLLMIAAPTSRPQIDYDGDGMSDIAIFRLQNPSPGPTPFWPAVTINEVNWGGTLESDTGEWIELFNSGSTVDLSDWVISVDNATTADWTFTLSGIAISDYLVLARGTDSTGGKADFIYPGADAFDDNGAIITLIDSYGQTQDTVSFSGGWPAGAQGISMERVTVGGSSWASALVMALYGTLGIDRGTPRALNSVSSASGTSPCTSLLGLWAIDSFTRTYFGIGGDKPVPGDYDGDGRSEIAIFRPSTGMWKALNVGQAYFGRAGDIPCPGGYDGDGTEDAAIFRPTSGLWSVRNKTRLYFGSSNDLPVPADYDGDGKVEIAIFRPSQGLWAVRLLTRVYFGNTQDYPVPVDFSGNGIADIAIFRPSSGLWSIRNFTRQYFGYPGDFPQPGIWELDSDNKVAVFRPINGLWASPGISSRYFGRYGDTTVAARIVYAKSPTPITAPTAAKTATPNTPVKTALPRTPTPPPTPQHFPSPSPSRSPTPGSSPFDMVTILSEGSLSGPMWSVFADKDRIYGASDGGRIFIWDRSGLSFNQSVVPSGLPQHMYSTASAGNLLVGGNQNGSVYVWSFDIHGQLSFNTTLSPSGEIIYSVFADSDYIYASSADQNVYVWNTSSFALQTVLPHGTDQMTSVYADSDYIYGACANNYIYVWNRNLSFNTAFSSSSQIMSSVTADSNYIYGGSEDRNVYVWNRAGFALNTRLTGATEDIESVASDDRAYIYGACSDSKVYVWETAAFAAFTTLPQGTGPMHSVFADRYAVGDGITHYIFGANDDGGIYVWLAERTPTSTPKPTLTPSPAGFHTPSPSPIPTSSPSPSRTPSPNPTVSPTPTSTPGPSPIPTQVNRLIDPEFDVWSSQSETHYWAVKFQGSPGTWTQTTSAYTALYAGDIFNGDSAPAWVYQTGLPVVSAETYYGGFYVKGWGTVRVGINDSGGWSYSSPTAFSASDWTALAHTKLSSFTSSTASLAMEVKDCSGGPLTVDSAWFSDQPRSEPGPPFSRNEGKQEHILGDLE